MEAMKILYHIHLKRNHQVPTKAWTKQLIHTITLIQISNQIQAKPHTRRGRSNSSGRQIKSKNESEVAKICRRNQKVNHRKHKYSRWMLRNRHMRKRMLSKHWWILMVNSSNSFSRTTSTSVILKKASWMKRCQNAHSIRKTILISMH